jgi:hypothetical protein
MFAPYLHVYTLYFFIKILSSRHINHVRTTLPKTYYFICTLTPFILNGPSLLHSINTLLLRHDSTERNIPLWTGELSLGVQTPLPRQKTTFGHYHSYRFILSIEKERRRESMMYLTFDIFPSCSNPRVPNNTCNGQQETNDYLLL